MPEILLREEKEQLLRQSELEKKVKPIKVLPDKVLMSEAKSGAPEDVLKASNTVEVKKEVKVSRFHKLREEIQRIKNS